MLNGIKQSIDKAQDVQDRFNELSQQQREKALEDHERLMLAIMSKYMLSCICTTCSSIMDSFTQLGEFCPTCGSSDIASEYWS